jgi:uncharacterized oligopeptide transporter (OPT) family protein
MKKYFYDFAQISVLFIFIVAIASVLIASFYGYIHNIVNLYHSPMSGKCIVQYLGIVFPPLGVLLGWFT